MKKLHYVFIFLIAIFFSNCGTEEKFTEVYVLIDVTDKTLKENKAVNQSIPKILKKIGVSSQNGGYSGGEVKLFLINELSESISSTFRIEKGVQGMLGDNILDRQDKIKEFESKLDKAFSNVFDNSNFDRSKSKIYQNLCREINSLKQNIADNKIIIVYSDMLENSELFSIYTDNTDNIKIEDFEKKHLQKDCLLPDLSDIDIFVVTNRNQKNDENINKAERFWKQLFKSHHVKSFTLDAELND